jgi:phosphate-selective porin
MSEGEVAQLRRDIASLSAKADTQHEANQKDREADRKIFQAAMQQQRDDFQKAINAQFLEHVALETKVEVGNTLLRLAVGSGQAGEGRVGVLEKTVETLKQFRWQTLAIISFLLLLAENLKDFFKH